VNDQAGVVKYLAKALENNVNYENFVVPDQFKNG
jgi:hypothetical protein